MEKPKLVNSNISLPANGALDPLSVLLSWTLDPQYYMFEGCQCEAGYNKTLVSVPHIHVVPTYACLYVQRSWFQKNMWFISIIVVIGVLFVCWVSWMVFYRKGARPALLQAVINMQKRVKGEPLGGTISVVHTDVEGYTTLMMHAPELMIKALNLHNAAIRKAKWTMFGYTIAEEHGVQDFSFYEPLDAVMFCLMLQQLLMLQPWPEGLFKEHNTSFLRKKTGSLLPSLASMWRSRVSKVSLTNLSQAFVSNASLSSANMASLPASSLNAEFEESIPESSCFNGIRVRMGIATGVVEEGTAVAKSAVMEIAKVVGDAGSGGQVLMDQNTFLAVKERLEELAAVTHKGMSFKKLNQLRPPWWMFWNRGEKKAQAEALVLDMGEYTQSAGHGLPSDSSYALKSSAKTPSSPGPEGSEVQEPKHQLGPLRLFQIMSPDLVARAKVFGNRLWLREEWTRVDQPYFSAPGTLEAPIGTEEGSITLPHITMVFASVDGGKVFAARSRKEAREVHDIIASVIYSTLRQVRGGYLCRLQDGDLKYMLAFPTPVTALAWCLVTQEAMMYAAWPESILRYDKFREEYGPDNELLFRGPRLKMGVCDGPPKSILPDHMGRADYHGASINQSARFMDAGAHGGQVVCEQAMAIEVLELFQKNPKPEPAGQIGDDDDCLMLSMPPKAPAYATGIAPRLRVGTGPLLGGIMPTVSEDADGEIETAASIANSARLEAAIAAAATTTTTPRRKAPEISADPAASTSGWGSRSSSITGPTGPPRASAGPSRMSAAEPHTSAGEPRTSSGELRTSWGEARTSAGEPRLSGGGDYASRPQSGDGPPRSTSLLTPHQAESAELLPMYSTTGDLEPPSWAYQLFNPEDSIYVTEVRAYKTGVFRFKGSNEDIHMVHVSTSGLDHRRFPTEPPKGKGNRIAEASGLVMSAEAQLPDICLKYQENYYKMLAENPPALRNDVGGLSVTGRKVNSVLGSLTRSKSGHTVTDMTTITPTSTSGTPGKHRLATSTLGEGSPGRAAPHALEASP